MSLEALWNDTCNIYGKSKTLNTTTKRTGFTDSLLYANIPCRISFQSSGGSFSPAYGSPVARAEQSIRLFLGVSYNVPAGSKIVVTRQGRTETYKASGESAVYSSHQEIKLAKDELC